MKQLPNTRARMKPLLVIDTLHHRIKMEAAKRRSNMQQITEAAREAWLHRMKQTKGGTPHG